MQQLALYDDDHYLVDDNVHNNYVNQLFQSYKWLADLLSEKQDKAYSLIIGWLRCCLTLAILYSAIICLQGSRFSYHRLVYCDLALTVHEGRVSL